MKLLSHTSFKFTLLLFLTMIFNSCLKDRAEEEKALEMRILNDYIQNNYDTIQPTPSGLYYIAELEGGGIAPGTGDYVVLNYTLSTLSDERIRTTTDSVIAKEEDIYSSWRLYGPETLQLTGTIVPGLYEGVLKMQEGGKSRLIFPSSLGWGSGGFYSPVPPFSSIIIDVELIKVIKSITNYETQTISTFLAENEIPSTPNSDGIYFESLVEGTGDTIQTSKYVSANIKAYLLDGRQIVNLNNYRFQYQVTLNPAVTTGFTKGVGLIREGGRARWLVPSSMAFGQGSKTGFDELTKIPIPPYSPVLYDVTVVSVK